MFWSIERASLFSDKKKPLMKLSKDQVLKMCNMTSSQGAQIAAAIQESHLSELKYFSLCWALTAKQRSREDPRWRSVNEALFTSQSNKLH